MPGKCAEKWEPFPVHIISGTMRRHHPQPAKFLRTLSDCMATSPSILCPERWLYQPTFGKKIRKEVLREREPGMTFLTQKKPLWPKAFLAQACCKACLEQVSVISDLKGTEGRQKQRKSSQETIVLQ